MKESEKETTSTSQPRTCRASEFGIACTAKLLSLNRSGFCSNHFDLSRRKTKTAPPTNRTKNGNGHNGNGHHRSQPIEVDSEARVDLVLAALPADVKARMLREWLRVG